MTTLQNINSAIISGQFTNDELNQIGEAIKFARIQLVKENRGSLVVGTKVKFTSGRTGGPVFGTVEKVNRKYIIVRENGFNTLGGSWRVPANMLEAV
jgi:hypothetical protein